MAALDAGVFNSKQFLFVVGASQAVFRVHAAIIAKQSNALYVLINGAMAEASEGKATFEDVQEDVFERFCQFAYTGNYTTPESKFGELPPPVASDDSKPTEMSPEPGTDPDPEAPPAQDAPPAAQDAEPDLSWEGWANPKKAKKLSKSRLLRQSLDDQVYDMETLDTAFTAPCEIHQNSSAADDYTPVFLGHAQIYVFAQKWGIKDLKTLALFKLHKTLVSFTLHAARRRDIVELLRYAYSNDHTPDRDHAVDDLRSLVMLYTACEVESLTRCPEFLALVGEGGQLAQDLVRMLIRRIA